MGKPALQAIIALSLGALCLADGARANALGMDAETERGRTRLGIGTQRLVSPDPFASETDAGIQLHMELRPGSAAPLAPFWGLTVGGMEPNWFVRGGASIEPLRSYPPRTVGPVLRAHGGLQHSWRGGRDYLIGAPGGGEPLRRRDLTGWGPYAGAEAGIALALGSANQIQLVGGVTAARIEGETPLYLSLTASLISIDWR